jgi:hypothetical protein
VGSFARSTDTRGNFEHAFGQTMAGLESEVLRALRGALPGPGESRMSIDPRAAAF